MSRRGRFLWMERLAEVPEEALRHHGERFDRQDVDTTVDATPR